MCGACGRTIVADPILGPVRTMRQHLIVAATISAVCTGLPGAPKVTALADGWMMKGPSGASAQCRTVEELCSAVLGCFTNASVIDHLVKRGQAHAIDPANAGLPALVARAFGASADAAASPDHSEGELYD
ncbi:hypothetical protein [Arthrobacter sp. efr-133-TYG-104]|uniref:hypothetical protein n=1 Tax=Arthrobacter sp. efr-133-TYG-104 TaxID=3040324 RepID=UPI00254F483F|nr:hypothetical protein [Arthrobacter sp. efr-133-TYG-104]